MEGISSPWFIMKAKWSKDEKKRLDLLTNRLYQLARQFGVDLRAVVKGGGPNGRHPMTPGFIYGAHTAFARSQYRFDKTFKSPEINIKQPTPPNLPPCQVGSFYFWTRTDGSNPSPFILYFELSTSGFQASPNSSNAASAGRAADMLVSHVRYASCLHLPNIAEWLFCS
jgi:hypothetical protein